MTTSRGQHVEDDFNIRLADDWIGAELPIWALSNKELKSFFIEILYNSEVTRDVGYVAAFEFLSDIIRISETQGYTAANADKNIEDLSEKLNVLSNTGNPPAELP